MKFEEVLPKMRDEGRIGILYDSKYSFDSCGNLVRWEKMRWRLCGYYFSIFTSDEWSLEPIKIKR